MSRACSICLQRITNEEAPVITMGGYGTPRLICDECAADIDLLTTSHDYDEIVAAMDRIATKMSRANIDDKATLTTVTELLRTSAERATAIKEGTYDFSLDEIEEEDYEIPEDMKESEEDRALDEKERERTAKFDKVMNWVWLAVLVAVIGFVIWRLVV